MPRELSVTLDGSALDDARRTAGIGRYVESLVAALGDIGGLRLSVARPRRGPSREVWVVRYANAQPAVVRSALRHRAALVHATATDPAAWPLRRQVVTVHDVVPWTGDYAAPHSVTARYLAWQRRRFRHCAAVIAVSDAVAAEAVEVLHLDERRTHVVPEGYGAAFTPAAADDVAARAHAGVTADRYVLWAGSMRSHDPRKALGVLVEAMAGLEGVTLVLAGQRGEAADMVAAHAARAGVPAVFTGYVPDQALAALMRGAAAVVLPSLHEGFGLPALEAMACGAPLVASRAGNLPGLVGEAGVLVEPGDPAGLAQALRAVLDDAALAARLREAGPRRAEPYSWRRTAEATVAVYHRALER